jgi:hypothetical protein
MGSKSSIPPLRAAKGGARPAAGAYDVWRPGQGSKPHHGKGRFPQSLRSIAMRRPGIGEGLGNRRR